MIRGRPETPPSRIINVPINKISAVEDALGRTLVIKQIPTVKIRVAEKDVKKIRKALKK